MKHVQWIIAAAASAFACHFAVVHTTPVDRALPFIGVVLALLAFDNAALLVAVPALMVAEVAIADEAMRLTALGVVIAASICGAAGFSPPTRSGGLKPAAPLVVASLFLLRWIPMPDHPVREVALIVIALAITFVLGRTPFAVAAGVIAALLTPAVPLRTLALPLLVLFVAALARLMGMPRLRLALPSAIALGLAFVFFAWSGLVARAFPYFLKTPHPLGEKYLVNAALAASQSATLFVPDDARALIVSGANVPRLRRGARLGVIEPGNIAVRIGDAADWGYLRRDQFYGSRNPLPRDPAGSVREYGYAAWIDGAGRVPLPRGARTIRVTADAALPPGASLQVEGFEIVRR
ncbi:MAG TPA: hypothetical protein VKB93_23795 [Thermoanaerobaculia bacterium]|nr:hypothetical protein [Thermoanaerobaculia bacterium]